jgi:soluble lytic murein transglycosylase-like protein
MMVALTVLPYHTAPAMPFLLPHPSFRTSVPPCRVSARCASVLLIFFSSLWTISPAYADRQQDPELGAILQKALQEEQCFEDRYDREVWYASMEPRLRTILRDERERSELLDRVHCEARRLSIPPGLVMAVIDVESHFDRWAVSSAGAVGLMQVMPFWPRQLGMTNAELVRIPQNIHMGCTILKFYLDREKGDYTRALARYNGSTGRRNYSDLVLQRLASRWAYR